MQVLPDLNSPAYAERAQKLPVEDPNGEEYILSNGIVSQPNNIQQ